MAPSHHISKLLHGQRGGVAILFALCLPVLIGFTALAVDLARINLTKVELQNAADAAAVAGARSISDPSTVASDKPYNWTAARATALVVAKSNYVNGTKIQDATINTGYWNITNPSLGFRPSTGIPVTGDVPAIRVTIALSSGHNNGPLRLFFAPVLGIAPGTIQASAIAVIAAPGAGTGMFPFVISKKFIDHYWNSTSRTPVLVNGKVPTVNLHSVYNIDGQDVLSGQFTSFTNPDNSASLDVSTTEISIGTKIYLKPGAKASLYKTSGLPVGQDVTLFIVDDAGDTHDFTTVRAIAGFHITGSNQGSKIITGYFIDASTIGTTNPGTSNGIPYGAYTPPILVQ
jgi:hypothetical protein